MEKKNEPMICSCGRPLIPILDENGKKSGVTHSIEDEDWHFHYWSTEEVLKRIKSN